MEAVGSLLAGLVVAAALVWFVGPALLGLTGRCAAVAGMVLLALAATGEAQWSAVLGVEVFAVACLAGAAGLRRARGWVGARRPPWPSQAPPSAEQRGVRSGRAP